MEITQEDTEQSLCADDLLVVEGLIEKVRTTVNKVTCGDLTRLLSLRLDLLKQQELEEVREIKVTWDIEAGVDE